MWRNFKLLCDYSSFDIPLHDTDDVRKCTPTFKQICMMLELQTLHVKVGVDTELFLDAFEKQLKYMNASPKTVMVCPPSMRRGVHEQRTIKRSPSQFWGMLSEQELIFAFVDKAGIGSFAEKLVRKKILYMTATKCRTSLDYALGLPSGLDLP